MLQLNFIRENKKDVISGLKKRGFNNFDLIENILCQDDLRKKTQAILDDQLSKANLIAKKIGLLLKSGEKEKAEILKSKSIDLKKNNKELEETLNKIEDELTQLRYQIPNVPNKIVIKGFSEKDNQEIEKFGKFPKLNQSNCLPHWELAKKYNLIDFDLGNKITGAGFPVYIDKGAKTVLPLNMPLSFTEYNISFPSNFSISFTENLLGSKDPTPPAIIIFGALNSFPLLVLTNHLSLFFLTSSTLWPK